MRNFLKADEQVKRMLLLQAGDKIGLSAKSVEKDLWVTQVLHALFSLDVSDKMIFKGGTSLSKAWGLIDRFSEDIDLAIDPVFLGAPDGDPTKKQIKKLRKASSLYVAEELAQKLRNRFAELGLTEWLSVEAQPNGEGDNTYPEPRQIYVRYKSLYADNLQYLLPMIVLEVSARSLMEPVAEVKIYSLASRHFPLKDLASMPVVTAVPGKAMVEKMFLLHELFAVEGHGMKAERKSRHLYDLYKMMDKPFAEEALRDDALWESIRHHRQVFTSVSGIDYTPDMRERMVLVPRTDIVESWKRDYENMCDAMIYGETPTWERLIEAMEQLQIKVRKVGTGG
ncbi:MAG: nucleotidyl transferase AbiEii/AbiGii toxin family protein [Alloprevotella sp.]|nr:nucleotidyl transferase AbiEii/AbiGii toxin family protein [Alloprevotella sp.]